MTTSIQEYGTGSIFAVRMQSLIERAELYFRTHPNQEIEGEFSELVDIAKKLSERRNEIAHGIVNPMVDSSSIQNVEFRYYLLTPMYAVMKKSTANFDLPLKISST